MSKGLSENPNQSPVVWLAFALTPSNKLEAPFAAYFGLGEVTKLKAEGVDYNIIIRATGISKDVLIKL